MNAILKNRWPLLVLPFVVYLLFAFSFEKKYALSFNLTKGKKYVYAATAKQVIGQEVNGQKMEFTQAFGFDYLLEVQAKDKEKNSTINLVYEKIKVNMNNPVMNVDYDSSKPMGDSIPAMAKVFASMKGQSISAIVSPNGNVKSVQGAEKMINSMANSIAPDDTAQLAAIKEKLATQFDEASQRSSVEGMTYIYPSKKVAIGATWTIVTNQKSIFPIKAENVYKLISVSGDIAKISHTAKLSGGGNINGGDLTLKGDLTGDLEMNIKTGLVIKIANVQNLSGTLAIQGMSVPMKISTTSTGSGKEQ